MHDFERRYWEKFKFEKNLLKRFLTKKILHVEICQVSKSVNKMAENSTSIEKKLSF